MCGTRWHGDIYCVSGQILLPSVLCDEAWDGAMDSIAYLDCHEDMPIYTRFNIRHSYPGFRWRGLWRPFFLWR
jgi:hypothetical protein